MAVTLEDIQTHLIGPMAAFWSGGGGPSGADVETALASAHVVIDENLRPSSKARLIHAAYRSAATSKEALELTRQLHRLLNRGPYLVFPDGAREYAEHSSYERHQLELTSDLTTAMRAIGGELMKDGMTLPDPAANSAAAHMPERVSPASIPTSSPREALVTTARSKADRRVFLVHGRDTRRADIENYLFRHSIQPTVLQEQAGGGKTIIEKFEDAASEHSHVIVLATGDDWGALRNTTEPEPTLSKRPRQNVILELGYFWAKLGRSHITILTDNDVELPSDLKGISVVYLGNDWKYDLLNELEHAGLA